MISNPYRQSATSVALGQQRQAEEYYRFLQTYTCTGTAGSDEDRKLEERKKQKEEKERKRKDQLLLLEDF
ncbi:MAG: hypothetical protein ACFFC6_11265 [Promethearchaeota archaeon]